MKEEIDYSEQINYFKELTTVSDDEVALKYLLNNKWDIEVKINYFIKNKQIYFNRKQQKITSMTSVLTRNEIEAD